jgi:hypothetical protein
VHIFLIVFHFYTFLIFKDAKVGDFTQWFIECCVCSLF